MPRPDDLRRFLDGHLEVDRFPADEAGGVFIPSDRAVSRLGVALEPWPGIGEWIAQQEIDALFLHRPWKFRADDLPAGVGVLAYHLPFDERLTIGFNPLLAREMGIAEPQAFGEREGRALGMVGRVARQEFTTFRDTLFVAFGGLDEVRAPAVAEIDRIAVVGALRDELVRRAAAAAVGVYVTGQWRPAAADAVRDTGIGVVAVGHRRCEEWGLRMLAGILRERWAELEIIIAPAAREPQ